MTQVRVTVWQVQLTGGCLSFEPIGDKLAHFTFDAKNIAGIEAELEKRLAQTGDLRKALARSAALKYPEGGHVDFSFYANTRKFPKFDALTTALERKLRFNAAEYLAKVAERGVIVGAVESEVA
jgi:hypothetical protein